MTPGRCLLHGIALERCCYGWEPDRAKPFLSDAIRRAKPSVDSPLGDLISGKIDRAEYERRMEVRRQRERADPLRPPEPDPEPAPRRRNYGCWFWMAALAGFWVAVYWWVTA